MVNPDHVGVVQSDSISSPHVLGVDIREGNVLHNDIRGLHNADTLALDGGTGLANKRLVARDRDTLDTSVVVRYRYARRVRLVVGAPVVLVDGNLASAGGSPGGTSRGGGGTLGASEVIGSLEDDDTGLRVTQVGDQLIRSRGVDRGGAATTGDALGETLSGACGRVWVSVCYDDGLAGAKRGTHQ